MAAPFPPLLIGGNPPLPPADERDALRAAAWMSVSGTAESRQLQALSAQVYLLTEWVRFLSNCNWAVAALPQVPNPLPRGGGGGGAPPPPPTWPPA